MPGADSIPWPRLRARHLRLGRRGERLAAKALEEIGFDLLVRNYRCPAGEVDIVARENAILCFIEVKTRRKARFARPAAAVGRAKRRRILRSAAHYLREIGHPAVPVRFDIVEVLFENDAIREIVLHRAAFTSELRSPLDLHFPDIPQPEATD